MQLPRVTYVRHSCLSLFPYTVISKWSLGSIRVKGKGEEEEERIRANEM